LTYRIDGIKVPPKTHQCEFCGREVRGNSFYRHRKVCLRRYTREAPGRIGSENRTVGWDQVSG
jgi:hypothetical protein